MASYSTTEGQMYLLNVQNPIERVSIQFFPAELTFNREIKTNSIEVIGRNNPLHHFTGGATSFNLTLDFYAEEDSLEDVQRRIKMIESWSYNEGYEKGVNQVKIVWGKLFKAQEVWVITKCSYKMEQFDKKRGFLPRQAYMELTFSLDTKSNIKSSEIKNIWA